MTTTDSPKRKITFSTTLLLIVIAIVGIIAPIVWDTYQGSVSLELQHLSTVTVFESPELEKLQIFYDGRPIKSVYRMGFNLVNVGRNPIRKEDIVSFPTLKFQGDGELLDIQVEKVEPSNLQYSYNVDKAKKQLSITFPLFNSGDSIQFRVLLGGSLPSYDATARIAGVRELIVVDRTKELQEQRKSISWTVYFVGFFTFSLLLGAFIQRSKEKRVKKSFLIDGTSLPRFNTKEEYRKFVHDNFSYTAKRKTILAVIDEVSDEEDITDEQQANIETAMLEILNSNSENQGCIIMLVIIIGLGMWYILFNLL
ncbi:MAG: hypothetical protein DRR19_14065 [Candidatus Parabeggiatoa sp. nov. 1]|nr:MAG: hypothetical protein DRR19_14065 [Gammaproteobacteria bacterium]HEC85493.1 hypothetical protein [Thioploca sp.]